MIDMVAGIPHLLCLGNTGGMLTDVDVWQQVAAGDDVDLLRDGLQVVQDESDAVGGVDDGALGGVELDGCVAHLRQGAMWFGSGPETITHTDWH